MKYLSIINTLNLWKNKIFNLRYLKVKICSSETNLNVASSKQIQVTCSISNIY